MASSSSGKKSPSNVVGTAAAPSASKDKLYVRE